MTLSKQIKNLFIIILSFFLLACDKPSSPEAFPKPTDSPLRFEIQKSKPHLPAVVKIPDDEAPHQFMVEWWYYTGHVETMDGKRYGIIFVVFQNIRADLPVVYAADFAIQDENLKYFKVDHAIQVVNRDEIKFGGTNGFNIKLGDWKIMGKNGQDSLQATMKDKSYGLNIKMEDVKGITLPAGGLVNYGKRVPWLSYYYQRPRMKVSGTITVNNETKAIKQGQVWFDHQWADFATVSTWDWFSAQLDDGSELMVYKLYKTDNTLLHILGLYVPPCENKCTPNQFIKAIDLPPESFTATATDSWKSAKTNISYPINWHVLIKGNEQIPSFDLQFKPVLLDAEIVQDIQKSIVYWEGDHRISGTKDGKPITGSGFIELARRLDQTK